MNPFKAAAAASSAAVDRVFGERLQWLPMASAGELTAGRADPSRPAREFLGAVTLRPVVVKQTGTGAHTRENAEATERRTHVSFASALGGPDGIRAGDHVVRLEEPGQPRLKLLAPQSIEGRIYHPAIPVQVGAS